MTRRNRTLEMLLGAAAVSLLPVDVAAADGAYSTRKISTTYVGNCLLLRRSTDDAEMAFGFADDGWLDTASILTWLNGANAFAKTWYDQSGNGNNVSQITKTRQPQLVFDDGSGKPTLSFNGSSRYLQTTAYPTSTQGSVYVVATLAAGATDVLVASGDEAVTTKYLGLFNFVTSTTTQSIAFGQGNADTVDTNMGEYVIELSQMSMYLYESDGSQYYFERNGRTEGIRATSGANTGDWFGDAADRDNFTIGVIRRSSVQYYHNGYISEVVVYPVKLADGNKSTVKSNVGTAYSLTIANWPGRAHIWFGGPWAVTYNGKTYIVGVNADYDMQIIEITNATRKLTGSYTLKAAYGVNDHTSQCVLVLPDGKLLVAYMQENGAEAYIRKSSNAENITAWGAETNIDSSLGGTMYTYPTLIQLTGEANSPVYLIYRDRGLNIGPAWSKSTDSGDTWVAQAALVSSSGNTVYFRVVQNGTGRIDFAITNDNPNSSATSLYHFYYQGGNFYKSDGTLIGDATALPLDIATDMTLVYDGSTTSAWVWDIAADGSGNPIIVYVTLASGDYRYRYARWTGAAWSDNEIAAMGGGEINNSTSYAAGVYLDHTNTNIVYLAAKDANDYQIYKYVTADGGTTWTPTQITSDDFGGAKSFNMRPVVPLEADSDLAVLWMHGRYTTMADYDTILQTNPAYSL